jgi:uncharacterized protein
MSGVDPPLQLPVLEHGSAYRFHTMIKPSGAQCNLDCTYCYYLHKEDLLAQPKMTRMSIPMLEMHIRQYIAAQTSEVVVFSWQGGEPTLMGLEFFENVVALQAKYRKPNQRIENNLQTNGLLLDEAWCAFLKKHKFLVGLSIDGPAELHDRYRINKSGGPTFQKVMNAVQLLHHFEVPFNALCVVNRVNARRPNDTYRFLRDKVRPGIIQFIPGLEPVDFHREAPGYWKSEFSPVLNSSAAKPGGSDSVVTPWSLDPDDWGYFLTRIWDEWLRRDYGRVFVDQFENVISQMFGHGPQKCSSAPACGKGLAIEHNGDLYSCDHFVYNEYKLGNIAQVHQGDLAFSKKQQEFGSAKNSKLTAYCKGCQYLHLCWGDCPKNRCIGTPNGEAGLSYLCSGFKQFYAKAVASHHELTKRMGYVT